MDTKALRQKILDLAIRGKLVPQDPNDEPASVLLERIRAEKQQMVKDGKLKPKDIKNDTIIFKGEDNLHYEKFPDGTVKCIEDEIPFELPQGWEWCRLSVYTAIMNGDRGKNYPSKDKLSKDNSGIPFISASDINNGYVLKDNMLYMSNKQYELLSAGKLKLGDIVFCIRGSLGKCGRFMFDNGAIASSLVIVRGFVDEESYLEYLYQYLLSPIIFDEIKKYDNGSAQPNLAAKDFMKFFVPVPPLAEQHRIVSKINELLSFVDIIESDKTDLQTTIQLTKSKILDLAIRGKLVLQNPDDEPASVLLDRIRAEKEELIKQGKIKRDKKESVIFRGEDNSYYGDIPDNWEVASISQLNFYQSSSVNPLLFPDEYFELFSVPNYDIGVPEIVKGKEIGSTKQSVEGRDVLLCKINPRINRVWNVNCVTEYKTIASSEWIVFRNPLLYSPYVNIYLSSPLFRELLLTNVSGVGGSLMRAQPNSVKKYPIAIPPFEEQKRIADKVSQLFSLLDSIAENIN